MSRRELDAAGITGRQLRASYEACRRLNATASSISCDASDVV